MDETKPTKNLLLTDIPLSDLEPIEREAARQQRPLLHLLRLSVAQYSRRIRAVERRAADRKSAQQEQV